MSLARRLQGAGKTVYTPVVTYQGSITGTGTTITYTAAPIGTAAANRVVIVTTGARDVTGSTSGYVTSVSIGGITATKQVESPATPVGLVSIWSAVVPTGTTANVVVGYSGSSTGVAFSVHTIHGGASATAKLTASASDDTASTSISTTMNVSVDDIVIMTCASDSTGSFLTFVGVTKKYEADQLNGTRGIYAVGSDIMTATQTGRTFSTSQSSSDRRKGIAVASFNK